MTQSHPELAIGLQCCTRKLAIAGEGTRQVIKGAGLNMRLRYAIVMKGGGHQEQRRSLWSWMIAIHWQLSCVTDWGLGRSTAEFFFACSQTYAKGCTSSTIPLLLPHMRSSMMNFAGHGFVLLLMVRCNFNSLMTLCFVIFFVVCIINAIFVVQPLKLQNIERILEQTLN